MKKTFKLLLIIIVIMLTAFSSSCKKDKKDENKKENVSEVSAENKETKNKEKGKKTDESENNPTDSVEKGVTDEQRAKDLVTAYVNAAKKLDFDAMNKYISDNKSFPILDSYRDAYSKYSISDSRIKELCRAKLGTYKITPISAVKSGNNEIVSVKISRVNMESLQNKWLEAIGNKYPEYANITEEQMTPQIVDTLIQVMIDVLKNAETTIDEQKDFVVENRNGSLVINAKNSDFFASN